MDIWFTSIHSTKHHYQGNCWIWSEGYQMRLKIWKLWEEKHFTPLCMPKHTDLTATGQISSSPVQMGCARCLVYLVPCHLEQLLQEQVSYTLWLEVFDLNPKRPFLKPKDHPTLPSSSAGNFSALKPTGAPVNANWGVWCRHIHCEANGGEHLHQIAKYIISATSCLKHGFEHKFTLESRKKPWNIRYIRYMLPQGTCFSGLCFFF